MTDGAGRQLGWWRGITFGAQRPVQRVVTLAGLGAVAGVAEAMTVILVVRLAAADRTDGLLLADRLPDSTAGLAAVAAAVVVALATAHLVSARVSARAGAEAECTVRTRLVAAYLAAPWGVRSEERAGELQQLAIGNGGELAHGTQQAATALASALNLAVAVAAALFLSPWTAIGVGAMAVAVFGIVRPLRHRTMGAARGATATTSHLAAEITETTMLAREIAAFGVEAPVRSQLADLIESAAAQARTMRFAASAAPALTRDASLAVLVLGVALVVALVDVSLPVLGATVVLLLRALGHAQVISGVTHGLAARQASVERIAAALASWETATSAPGVRPCAALAHIELAGVTFRYPGTDEPALRDVDLRIERGEQVGIVGRTGAGKTTLAGLLLGALHPEAGTVCVNGLPIETFVPGDWHHLAAWVPQAPALLTGTVADNIRFHREHVDDAAIADAARRAGLGAELGSWPDGVLHHVGPAGHHLSGGERQRVALARALAGRPQLLVLDEPTSALDARTETEIRRALAELRGSVAVVVIAHRLSTLESCDRVVVLDGHTVVADGVPADLASTSSYYREILALSGLA